MVTGRNQHFIPNFLLKAFGIRPARKEIWYFGRDEMAEKRRVKRTASGDFFYSESQAVVRRVYPTPIGALTY